MDDLDLIARIYPYSTEGVPFDVTKTSLNHLYLALPLHQEAQTLQYGRDDRRMTQPPAGSGDETTCDYKIQFRIEVMFSKISRSSNGLVFGCGKICDVVLPDIGGLSKKHFSITVGN